MDRDELALWQASQFALDEFGFETILEHNDVTMEEVLVFLLTNFGLRLPNEQDKALYETDENT